MVVEDRLGRLESRVREFAVNREWEPFHTPKNLVMALTGEVGELVAEFQWLTPEESCALSPEASGTCARGDGRRVHLPAPIWQMSSASTLQLGGRGQDRA
jgi:hypothetical protein